MVNKRRIYLIYASILLTGSIMFTLQLCSFKGIDKQVSTWAEHTPASWGGYKIDTVANEPLLSKVWTPTEPLSGCGLSDNDFIKYAMSKIDYSRPFQFIVFADGNPMVGKRCLRKAFIFYLKK